MDGGFACTWVEDNAMLGGCGWWRGLGSLAFSPMLGGRGCLLHLSLVGGKCRWSRQKLFWDCHAWTVASPVREPYVEDNALQSLVVTMTRAGSLAVQGRGEIKGLTGSYRWSRQKLFWGIAMHGRWLRLYVSHTWRIMRCNPWWWRWRELGLLLYRDGGK